MTVRRQTIRVVAVGLIAIAGVLASGLVVAVIAGVDGVDVLATALGGVVATLTALFVQPDQTG